MSQENFTETARLLAAEIAMAVVQSIRNDKDVIGRVAEILLPEISRIRRDATAEGIKAGMNAATAALINNHPEPDPPTSPPRSRPSGTRDLTAKKNS